MADVIDNSTSLSDDAALLDEGVPESPEVEVPEPEEGVPQEEEENEEEESDTEETEEEPEEEKARDLAPHERPAIKDVTAKFPNLFKEFPALKDMYFREKEFSSIYDSVESARVASENSEALETLRSDIFDGDGVQFLNAIKETDSAKLDKFAADILPALNKVSPDAHWKAAVPLLQNVVRSMFNEGKKFGETDQGNNYKYAAQHLAQYLFGDIKVASGESSVYKPKEEPTQREKDLTAREEKIEVDRFNSFRGTVDNSASSQLRSLIMEKDKEGNLRLDRDNVMSEFIKDTLVEKINNEVGKQLQADTEHMKYMASLWSRAKKEGYSVDSKARIVSAYLARARSIVPSVRAKLVSEALGTANKHNQVKKERTDSTKTRREVSGGRNSSSSSKVTDPKRIDYSKSSDMDILSDNITLKG